MYRGIAIVGIFATSVLVGFRLHGGNIRANVAPVEKPIAAPVRIVETAAPATEDDPPVTDGDADGSSESSKARSTFPTPASSVTPSSDSSASVASSLRAASSVRSSRSSIFSSLSWEQFTAAMHRGGGRGQAGIRSSATAASTASKAASIVTLATNHASIHHGDSVTFTATVTAGATGTVSFYTGATLIGTGTVSGGTATLTTTALAKGTGSIVAVYGGDSAFLESTSNTVTQIVYRNTCAEISPCQNGGSCTPVFNGYTCSCVSPWLGDTCNDRDNNCLDTNTGLYCSGASHGTCAADPSGGICQCAPCYTGDYCELDDLACA